MTNDDLQRCWQAQPPLVSLTLCGDALLQSLRSRNEQFASMIFWRDVREIGVALVLIVVWFVLGWTLELPASWYLMIPGLLWVAGFMLVDRWRYHRVPPDPSESLRRSLEVAVGQVEHQIRLLRNVLWWYLLPIAVPMLAFFAEIFWSARGEGWQSVAAFVIAVTFVSGIFGFIYWLNQWAVREDLIPRRDELRSLLAALDDSPTPTRE